MNLERRELALSSRDLARNWQLEKESIHPLMKVGSR